MNKEFFKENYKNHKFEHIKSSPKAMDAALLIPLVEDADGRMSLLFEVRSNKIIQGGEICLPGGRVEPDEDPRTAAVREAAEELLLKESQIEIIAPMFTMSGVGGAYIHSYLGFLHDYQGSFSEDEVGSVFMIPVDELLSMQPKINHAEYVAALPEDFHWELIPGGRNYPWRNRKKNFYFYETEYGVIWGMTGELLYNVLEHFRTSLGIT